MMTKANTTIETHQFEDALGELERIVNDMESGNLPLAESLKAYQRGVELLQNCQKVLSDIEQQVQILGENHQLSSYTISDD